MSKDFVIQLRCPYGDEDRKILLRNRDESLGQILDTSWDFECPVHGVQREIPLSAKEIGQSGGSRSRGSSAASGGAQPLPERAKPRSSDDAQVGGL